MPSQKMKDWMRHQFEISKEKDKAKKEKYKDQKYTEKEIKK